MTDENQNFIKLFIEGKQEVLEKIYAKNFTGVKKYILKNNGTKSDALDIFQEALLILYSGLKSGNLKIIAFDSYLFFTCKNLWIKKVTKNKVTETDLTTLISNDIEDNTFELKERQWELFEEKFNLLKDDCITILKLMLQKTPYESIFKKLNLPNENAARQKVFKCKKKLFKMIQSDKRYYDLKDI
ncbi:sigma-70 family RNA polymerase sigma factor [uncultured Tenacibaculum sp.]|uniref:RNA polymerase sigma factor n=1 Tax=uncultured Tenacibaculum sp. TaxID=174713 RepID=UPI002639D8B5|nr:sigma-70 family RNA polymerase sigma factor [uncultured Tenacibaculum sp.]